MKTTKSTILERLRAPKPQPVQEASDEGRDLVRKALGLVEEGVDSVKHKMQMAAVQHHREWADHHSGNMWYHSKDDEGLADKHLRANSAHHKAAWSHASGHADAMKHSEDAEKASDVAHKASRKKVESATVAHESLEEALAAVEDSLVLESHGIRIALPPGKYVKGSGSAIEQLHKELQEKGHEVTRKPNGHLHVTKVNGSMKDLRSHIKEVTQYHGAKLDVSAIKPST